MFGYFPTYTLGNLYGASLFAAARRAIPDLERAAGPAEQRALRAWLGERVHAVGRRLCAEEIVRAASGSGLSDEDFRSYLERKYLIELA
jgi:carboxypeptidase Taq